VEIDVAAKTRIIWDNRKFDAAVLTASSEADTWGVNNLQDVLRTRAWRTTGLVSQWVQADFGESIYCACLALVNHNLTYSGLIRVQASDDPAFAEANLLLNEEFPAWADIIGAGEGGAGEHGAGGVFLESERAYYTPDPIRVLYFSLVDGDLVSARYWRVLLVDPVNPDGYMQIGRIFLGLYDEYAKIFANDWRYGGVDDSEADYSAGGQPWTRRQRPRRILLLPWKTFKIQDKYWRFCFFRDKVGLSQDWIIDALPDGGPSERWFTTIFGRFLTYPELTATSPRHSELEIEIVESH
jgi:hypothetical protein